MPLVSGRNLATRMNGATIISARKPNNSAPDARATTGKPQLTAAQSAHPPKQREENDEWEKRSEQPGRARLA